MQFDTFLYSASLWVLPVVLAVTLHEAAHGFAAHRLGDDTAYRLGRVILRDGSQRLAPDHLEDE